MAVQWPHPEIGLQRRQCDMSGRAERELPDSPTEMGLLWIGARRTGDSGRGRKRFVPQSENRKPAEQAAIGGEPEVTLPQRCVEDCRTDAEQVVRDHSEPARLSGAPTAFASR